MDCIVTISGNLRPQVPVPSRNPLSFRSFRPISENGFDGLESTIIIQRCKYIVGIASHISVVVFQVGVELFRARSGVELHNLLGKLELPPKNTVSSELFNQNRSRRAGQ